MLAGAFTLHEFAAGSRPGIGPFDALTCLLPHWVPNAGRVPPGAQAFLSSAPQAGRHAAQAGAAQLALTHLWPGTSHLAARTAAAAEYHGRLG
jgi:hypothetical protein